MSAVRIAPATRADVPVLHELMRGLAVYEKLESIFVASAADLERDLFGEHPRAEALVGYRDDVPVGYAMFYPTYSSFTALPGVWLEDLFVLPEARGAGVGLALLAGLAAEARARGCNKVEWDVLDWNESAIGFYRALGAEPSGEWTTFKLGGDALARLAAK